MAEPEDSHYLLATNFNVPIDAGLTSLHSIMEIFTSPVGTQPDSVTVYADDGTELGTASVLLQDTTGSRVASFSPPLCIEGGKTYRMEWHHD